MLDVCRYCVMLPAVMTLAGKLPITIALGTAQTLAWASSYYLAAILAVPIARDLDLTPAWTFAGFSIALIVAAVLGPGAGDRIDKRGGRLVLAGSNLVFALALGLLAFADGPVQMLLAWALMGVGMATGLYEAGFATLAVIFGKNARGPITGITLMAGFASTVGWPVTAALEAEFGWRIACLSWAGAHLLLGLPLNLLLPRGAATLPQPGTASTAAPATSAPGDTRLIMALLAFVFAVTWFTSTAMAAHLPRLLESVGTSTAAAVAAGALIGPAQVGARILEFGILRRFHPLLSARLAAIAHPIGAVVLVLAGPVAAPAFAILHGAGNGILTIAKGTLPLALFGPQGYGLRQGILMIPARFGQAAAPFLFGFAIDRWGMGALTISAGLCLGGFVALLFLRQDRKA